MLLTLREWKKFLKNQQGEIATTLTLISLGVMVLGILVGSIAVRKPTRITPKAKLPSLSPTPTSTPEPRETPTPITTPTGPTPDSRPLCPTGPDSYYWCSSLKSPCGGYGTRQDQYRCEEPGYYCCLAHPTPTSPPQVIFTPTPTSTCSPPNAPPAIISTEEKEPDTSHPRRYVQVVIEDRSTNETGFFMLRNGQEVDAVSVQDDYPEEVSRTGKQYTLEETGNYPKGATITYHVFASNDCGQNEATTTVSTASCPLPEPPIIHFSEFGTETPSLEDDYLEVTAINNHSQPVKMTLKKKRTAPFVWVEVARWEDLPPDEAETYIDTTMKCGIKASYRAVAENKCGKSWTERRWEMEECLPEATLTPTPTEAPIPTVTPTPTITPTPTPTLAPLPAPYDVQGGEKYMGEHGEIPKCGQIRVTWRTDTDEIEDWELGFYHEDTKRQTLTVHKEGKIGKRSYTTERCFFLAPPDYDDSDPHARVSVTAIKGNQRSEEVFSDNFTVSAMDREVPHGSGYYPCREQCSELDNRQACANAGGECTYLGNCPDDKPNFIMWCGKVGGTDYGACCSAAATATATPHPTPIPEAPQICPQAGVACTVEYPQKCCLDGSTDPSCQQSGDGRQICHKEGTCQGVGGEEMCSWGPGSYCGPCVTGEVPTPVPPPTEHCLTQQEIDNLYGGVVPFGFCADASGTYCPPGYVSQGPDGCNYTCSGENPGEWQQDPNCAPQEFSITVQGRVERIVDDNPHPVANARILYQDQGIASTNSSGQFSVSFNVSDSSPTGSETITLKAIKEIGGETLQDQEQLNVSPDGNYTVDFVLMPEGPTPMPSSTPSPTPNPCSYENLIGSRWQSMSPLQTGKTQGLGSSPTPTGVQCDPVWKEYTVRIYGMVTSSEYPYGQWEPIPGGEFIFEGEHRENPDGTYDFEYTFTENANLEGQLITFHYVANAPGYQSYQGGLSIILGEETEKEWYVWLDPLEGCPRGEISGTLRFDNAGHPVYPMIIAENQDGQYRGQESFVYSPEGGKFDFRTFISDTRAILSIYVWHETYQLWSKMLDELEMLVPQCNLYWVVKYDPQNAQPVEDECYAPTFPCEDDPGVCVLGYSCRPETNECCFAGQDPTPETCGNEIKGTYEVVNFPASLTNLPLEMGVWSDYSTFDSRGNPQAGTFTLTSQQAPGSSETIHFSLDIRATNLSYEITSFPAVVGESCNDRFEITLPQELASVISCRQATQGEHCSNQCDATTGERCFESLALCCIYRESVCPTNNEISGRVEYSGVPTSGQYHHSAIIAYPFQEVVSSSPTFNYRFNDLEVEREWAHWASIYKKYNTGWAEYQRDVIGWLYLPPPWCNLDNSFEFRPPPEDCYEPNCPAVMEFLDQLFNTYQICENIQKSILNCGVIFIEPGAGGSYLGCPISIAAGSERTAIHEFIHHWQEMGGVTNPTAFVQDVANYFCQHGGGEQWSQFFTQDCRNFCNFSKKCAQKADWVELHAHIGEDVVQGGSEIFSVLSSYYNGFFCGGVQGAMTQKQGSNKKVLGKSAKREQEAMSILRHMYQGNGIFKASINPPPTFILLDKAQKEGFVPDQDSAVALGNVFSLVELTVGTFRTNGKYPYYEKVEQDVTVKATAEDGTSVETKTGFDGSYILKIPTQKQGKEFTFSFTAPWGERIYPDIKATIYPNLYYNINAPNGLAERLEVPHEKIDIPVLIYPFHLEKGWNLINLPAQSVGARTLNQLLSQIKGQGVDVWQASTFTDSKWKNFTYRVTPEKQELDLPQALMVRSEEKGVVYLQSLGLPAEERTLEFSPGNNLFGLLPSEGPYTAVSLLASINQQSPNSALSVSRYAQEAWETVVVKDNKVYGEDFAINPLEGYFIKMIKEAEWKP